MSTGYIRLKVLQNVYRKKKKEKKEENVNVSEIIDNAGRRHYRVKAIEYSLKEFNICTVFYNTETKINSLTLRTFEDHSDSSSSS